jgi:ABC-2 type transport system permease protein
MSDLVFPPVIALESEMLGNASATSADKPKRVASPSAIFLLVLPGVAVYGLFLVAEQGMRDVLTENTLGTLRRQLAGPVKAETVILGKAVYTAALASAAIVVLGAVGAVALSAPVSVPGFVVLSAALVLAVTGTTAVIYGAARTERQASTLANMIFLAMGFLGGGFIRVEGLPEVVRGIAPFTPLYWGTKGYRALLEDGAGLKAIAVPVGVLGVMGVVLLVIGALVLRRTARHGAGA